jgi:hypothetical protein
MSAFSLFTGANVKRRGIAAAIPILMFRKKRFFFIEDSLFSLKILILVQALFDG